MNFGVYSVDRSKEFMTLLVRSAFQKKKILNGSDHLKFQPHVLDSLSQNKQRAGGSFCITCHQRQFFNRTCPMYWKKRTEIKGNAVVVTLTIHSEPFVSQSCDPEFRTPLWVSPCISCLALTHVNVFFARCRR